MISEYMEYMLLISVHILLIQFYSYSKANDFADFKLITSDIVMDKWTKNLRRNEYIHITSVDIFEDINPSIILKQ